MTDTDLVTLRDGTELLIRPVEPADADDLQRGIEHLSPESRYRRFLGTPHIGTAELRYLTNVDHVDHEALTAIPPEADRLATHARAAGITRFTGLMLARNEPMIALLRRLGETRIHRSAPGTVEVAVDLR